MPQNISTTVSWATDHEAGVPLLTDAANIIEAFKSYHYGSGYDGTTAKTSGIDYHLGLKAPKASPLLTGTVNISASANQLELNTAGNVAKARITTNTGTGALSSAVQDDLSINSLSAGSKILVGINGTTELQIASTGVTVNDDLSVGANTTITGTLGVTGSAAFSGSVQFTGPTTAPTMATSDSSTRVATTALVTNKNTIRNHSYQLFDNIELWQPSGNVATAPTAVGFVATTTGTLTAVNVASTSTNYVTRNKRLQFATAAVAGTTASLRNGALQYSAQNGFLFYSKFAPQAVKAAQPTAARFFAGMWGTATAFPNATISAQTNILGVGYEAGDTAYRWFYNDGTGAATVTAMTNTPAISSTQNVDLCELWIAGRDDAGTGSGTPSWRFKMAFRLWVASGTSSYNEITLSSGADIPAFNTLLSWHIMQNNAAAAVNYATDICKVVVRSADILNLPQGWSDDFSYNSSYSNSF